MKTTVRSDYNHEVLDEIPKGARIVYMTAHRRENFGEKLESLCRAALRIVERFEGIHLIYPVHLNPNVRDTAYRLLGNHPRIHLIDPLGVIDNHNFMAKATLILSDSGGIQEEAPTMGVPVLVLRDTTERPEGVTAGTLKLVGTDEDVVVEEAVHLLTDETAYADMAGRRNPYGDGEASRRIVEAVLHQFGRGARPDPFH